MVQTASEKLRSAVLRVAARNSAVLALHTANGAAPPEGLLREALGDETRALVAWGPLLGEAWRQELAQRKLRLIDGGLDDLETDPNMLAERLRAHPVGGLADYRELERELERQRRENPWIASDSLARVLSDSTLNAYPQARGRAALASASRVLERGGKLTLSVLLRDEPLAGPLAGMCLANGAPIRCAPGETELFEWLVSAGFHGMTLAFRGEVPFGTCAGAELRYHVIHAYKGKQGPCIDHGHALIYRGPWSAVRDDDGHEFVRGVRSAVCAKTFALLTREPYADQFAAVPPYQTLPESECPAFDCNTPQVRDPAVTKGLRPLSAPASESTCNASDGSCC